MRITLTPAPFRATRAWLLLQQRCFPKSTCSKASPDSVVKFRSSPRARGTMKGRCVPPGNSLSVFSRRSDEIVHSYIRLSYVMVTTREGAHACTLPDTLIQATRLPNQPTRLALVTPQISPRQTVFHNRRPASSYFGSSQRTNQQPTAEFSRYKRYRASQCSLARACLLWLIIRRRPRNPVEAMERKRDTEPTYNKLYFK